jgi:predicted deacylase
MKKGADDAFTLGGRTVERDSVVRVDLELAALPVGIPLPMTVTVARGRRPGPRLFVTAAIHGDELAGILAVREVVQGIRTADLRGTVVAVPVVNAFGLLRQTRELPDGRDLNRCFPGSPRGSLAARVAHALLEEVVKRCTHGVDLHTAAQDRSNHPQIRADLRDRVSREMAEAFGAPVTVQAGLRDGSLREAATALGIPTILFETGEALRHDDESHRIGVRGVRGVMAYLGMIDPLPGPAPKSRVYRQSKWVRAEASGYLVGAAPLGSEVRRGAKLGAIAVRKERSGESGAVAVTCAEDGIVIGRRENPIVYEGDAIFHVALGGKRKAAKRKRARA